MIRLSPTWHESQLQDVVNNPKSCKVLVSKGRLWKLAAKRVVASGSKATQKHEEAGEMDSLPGKGPQQALQENVACGKKTSAFQAAGKTTDA